MRTSKWGADREISTPFFCGLHGEARRDRLTARAAAGVAESAILAHLTAVARLEQKQLAETWGPPEHAIAAALSLVALEGRLRGWPPPADPVTDREDEAMWARFARLRAKFVRR